LKVAIGLGRSFGMVTQRDGSTGVAPGLSFCRALRPRELRATLESDFEKADIAGPAEERHVAVEDALDQARKTLAGKPA